MKNILLLTDFSAKASHVANYAYDFAKKINAGITLCNAITVPSSLPNAGLVIWPMESPEVVGERSRKKLDKLRFHLQERDQSHTSKPSLTIRNQTGSLEDMVIEIDSERPIDLIAMGTHDADMDSIIKIDQAKNMIDCSPVPTLLIPLNAKFEPVRNIYFATDLGDLYGDRIFLSQLTELARSFKSEIFMVHISSSKAAVKIKEKIYDMLNDLRQALGYPGIHFQEIAGDNEVSCFEKIMMEKKIDLLVVVHREHGFFSRVFKGSVTKKLARQLTVPMLVYHQDK